MKQYFRRAAVGLVIAVVACMVYWGQMLATQRVQLQYAEEQVTFRATRLAEALAIQVNTLFSGLEYLVNSLAATYLLDSQLYFPQMVQTAFRTFPQDSIVQVSVANAKGELIYGNLRGQTASVMGAQSLSIADREHFLVHAQGRSGGRAFVSKPVFGRISQSWTVQISYPIIQNGEFLGVMVLSVLPSYVSGYFREVFTSSGDAAALVYSDGTYVARSNMEAAVMNKLVPPDRPFLHETQAQSGVYRATPDVDPVERLYAWHRVADYPLLVTIGLERTAGVREMQNVHRVSLQRSAIGTVVFLLFVGWIAWLVTRLGRDQWLLKNSEQRYKLALKGGELASWEWNNMTRKFLFGDTWAAMLGYQPGELSGAALSLLELIHPDERETVTGLMTRHCRGETALFESEHRIRHKDGHWVWVSTRGGVISRDEDGNALVVAGTQADISLQKEDTRLRQALFDNSAAEVVLVAPDTCTILMSNQRADQTFSPDGSSLVGTMLTSLHTNEENARRFVSVYTDLRTRGSVQLEAPLRNGKGEERWYAINGTLLEPSLADGEVIWTTLDITQRRQMEQGLADAWLRLVQVIEHFPGGVLVEDEHGKVLVLNQTFCDLLRLGRDATMTMRSRTANLIDGLPPEDALLLRESLPLEIREDVGQFNTDLAYRGRMLHVSITTIRRGGDDRGRLWVVEDITARLQYESDLNRMATTDALTGLPNRVAFLERLESVLLKTPKAERRGVLMMADLDRFKHVNDTYGHAVGDEVLRFLPKVFQSVLRHTDMAGRLGGEEFSVLVPDVDDSVAWRMAERIRATLESSEIPTPEGVVRITISIGMAHLSAGDGTAILAAADAALYKAKRSGRNRIEAAWEFSEDENG